jgi:2-dehydropantoate 2-reductase
VNLDSVDPGGLIARQVPVRQVVGAVVHMSSATPEPGLVRHVGGNRFILGEPDGGTSDRLRSLATLFRGADLEVELSTQIHKEVWYKLWGNMTTNPVSALTRATADRILDDPLVLRFCQDAMLEAQRIGALIGCPIEETPQDRTEVTRKLGAMRTSMLQDMEAGRPLELDALVGAVREIGERVGVPTPNLDALLGLTRLAASMR